MKNKLKYLLAGFLIAVIIFLLSLSWIKDRFGSAPKEIFITDTVFVKKPYKEVEVKYIEKPKTVYIYKTDTLYREKLEKDTLIAAVELSSRMAKIHTITPSGLPIVREYALSDYREIKIDHEGNMEVKKNHRKKFFRTLERVGIFAAGLFIGSRLAAD